MKRYELWRERENGEVWAVHLVEGAVVGCCGPLRPRDRDLHELSGLDYAHERAEWIDGHRDAFDPVDPATV